jgi:putative ABC transport system permease protein
MKISEIIEAIRISYESMWANKMRSFLASLGVVIGISFVILMGWVLSGLDKAMQDTFNIIGTDMLYVDRWDWAGGKSWKELRQRKNITLQQTEKLIDRLQSAEVAVTTITKWGASLKYENEQYSGFQIIGTTHEHGFTPAGEVEFGRHFSKFEEDRAANVVVIGERINETIFKGKNPIGETIKLNGHKFTIIGVIKKQGTMFFDFIDYQCFIPLRRYTSIYGKYRRSYSIAVKAGSEENLDEVRAETIGLMREIRNLEPHEGNDFSINETKAFESSVATIRLYVWGIGIGMTVLSFIVGIIGIMNIMFVSVTERTKEIGIRKAIGAKKSSIMSQFLVEAASLCFIGAITAFIGTSILIYLASTFLPKFVPELAFLPNFMPFELLFIATVVSVIVGVLAGMIPAFRASNLDPVDALRYE